MDEAFKILRPQRNLLPRSCSLNATFPFEIKRFSGMRKASFNPRPCSCQWKLHSCCWVLNGYERFTSDRLRLTESFWPANNRHWGKTLHDGYEHFPAAVNSPRLIDLQQLDEAQLLEIMKLQRLTAPKKATSWGHKGTCALKFNPASHFSSVGHSTSIRFCCTQPHQPQ